MESERALDIAYENEQDRQEWELQQFLANCCHWQQYDSCINSPCPYSSYEGCQHPDHPKNLRKGDEDG